MATKASQVSFLMVALIPSAALAKTGCPEAVVHAAQARYPQSSITSCKKEKEKGKTQYSVRVSTKDATLLELDVSPEGTILLTEEKVDVKSLPAPVTSAFASKYSSARVINAEKQVNVDGVVTYELSFEVNGKKREATFDQTGHFQEEE